MKIKSLTADDGTRWAVLGWMESDGSVVAHLAPEGAGPIPEQGRDRDASQCKVLSLLSVAGSRGATAGDIQAAIGQRHRVKTAAALEALVAEGLLVSGPMGHSGRARYWLPENRPVSRRLLEERAHFDRLLREIANRPEGAETANYHAVDLAVLRDWPGVRVFQDQIFVDPHLAGIATEADNPFATGANPFSPDRPA